ncbi:serine protease 52-like [Erinaceus europaeus]|uniref:Serine protease 52-like n=1 Tax=Erinaceus europaeus TaxID=9365 RepID=A0ABM3WWF4_ERIEU|nr:serine protease 52-like [Erinaceus europaeus]
MTQLWPLYHLSVCFVFFFCFELSTFNIAYGTENLNTSNSTRKQVNKIIIHPLFDSWLFDSDIALILLKTPIHFNAKNAPVCLSEVTNIEKWGSCSVAGWGIMVPMQNTELIKVDIKLVKWEFCSNVVPLLTKNMLCAGDLQGRKDACQGDSGGPLICHKTNNTSIWYQLGIVSWGVGCGRKRLPGVYTNVSNYLSWINKETTLSGKPYKHEPDSRCTFLLSSWAVLLLSFVMLLLFL